MIRFSNIIFLQTNTMQYSSEQLNYFRTCHVGFNLVPQGLRQIFKQEWNFRCKTGGEWQDTAQNGHDFFIKEGKKSRTKNARYLATIQNGNTAEWDCSCLFFAILFSDSIGTTLSPVIKNNVDYLRQVRNEIAHICEAKLTDAEFQSYIGRMLHSFTSLGLPVKDIEDVRKQTSFPTAELQGLESLVDSLKRDLKRKGDDLQKAQTKLQSKEEEVKALKGEIESKVKPFCILTCKPAHEVIRRSNDITRLKKKMQDLEDGSHQAVSTIYVSGTPGSGKSQLARQLGQEFFYPRSRDTDDLMFVATLNAESVETLADSYITLGKYLGISDHHLTSLETDKRENPKETIQRLKILTAPKVHKFSRWLLIADNVVELKAIHSFLPQTASTEWGCGQVLITTQDSSTIPCNAPHTYHESISKGMEEEDAMELLKQVSQICDEAEQVQNVAKVLEYQPLALAAAAFYVQTVVMNGSPDYSWARYLEVLNKGQREATEELLASESSAYSKTMTTAIRIALKRAIQSDEVLRLAFSFLALCSSELLPVEAIVNFVKARIQSELPQELIKAKILKSCLVLSSTAEEQGFGCLRLHKTVHEVLKQGTVSKRELADRNHNLATAIKILAPLLELEENQFKTTRYGCLMLNKMTSHCKALLESATCDFTCPESDLMKELTSIITLKDVVEWLCSTARNCHRLDDLASANRISELACNLLKNVSCDTLEGTRLKEMAFLTRGVAYCSVSKHQEAKDQYEKVLKICLTTYGESHPNTANIYRQLGFLYNYTGEYNKAIRLYEKALDIHTSIYDQENTMVASLYHGLGGVLFRIGKYKEAKRLHEKALAINKMIHGEEHADVGHSYSKLGAVCHSMGEFKKAKELHDMALTIRKKVYGELHTTVAESYSNLAAISCSIKEFNTSKELYEKALVIRRNMYGEEHGVVAATYNNLGHAHLTNGELKEAKEHFEKALAIMKKIFGEDHPDAAVGYVNLGTVYRCKNQNDLAKKHLEKALMIQKRTELGEKFEQTVEIYRNLATLYDNTGVVGKSIDL